MNNTRIQNFRARYRATISPRYDARLHAGFVFGFGVCYLIYQSMQLTAVQSWQWLALPFGLVFFNFLIYFIHRDLGHVKRRCGRLFYKRHTGDHHSFFSDIEYHFERTQDFRVILFPPALIILGCGLGSLFLFVSPWDGNAPRLFIIACVLGYLLYEFFHACHHLPDHYAITRWPWFKQMREWHRTHHHAQSTHRNYNLVLPLADYVMRTHQKR